MARSQNTFAKRQREMEKRLKAEAKRARKQKRKEEGIPEPVVQTETDEPEEATEEA